MSNAVGYMRLSFKDQSKYSLDSQEEAINAYCAKYGLELVALFKDNGQQSSSFDRLDFKALEMYVKKHSRLVNYIVVMEHDRFSRDLSEALSKIKKFESIYGIKVVSVDEPLDIDTEDPSVFISRAFRYATANAELLNIRARTKRGIQRARLEGRFINKAPFGYSNSRDFLGKSMLVQNMEEAEIVRKIFSYYLLGMSMGDIAANVCEIGFPLKGHNAVGRILDNYVYAGLVKLNSENGSVKYIKALHEAIVSEADFWLVQEMKNSKKPLKIKTRKDYLLKGLLKCNCGKYMTAGWSKGKKQYYLYYRCSEHVSVNIPGKKVHEQFNQVLENLKLTAEQLIVLNGKVREGIEKALVNEREQVAARKKMLKELDVKMESLEEHLINKTIDAVTFRKWSERYAVEYGNILGLINSTEKYVEERIDVTEKFMGKIHSVKDIIDGNTSPLVRLVILKFVFRYGIFYQDGGLVTHKICPALSHNTIQLTEFALLKIEVPRDSSISEEERFVNFMGQQLVDFISDYQ
ncbi:recombinase family protein [Flavobacterium lindanitolerans]|uniref:DNA invertase Pin-like site-specific DNA recombinase n=1 Tax=Flavobacterium lindanitolerans TaxID=428988 RepID=A0A497UUP6_9FLAO|nr:recombinase family protein [Flavobacterium lindanitolerans]MBC8645341.1 recombinase family protein [Flavobacterium lindanitolerans]PKW29648.1 DNA invertase Pin-like site-specific DNA recombinase [Flavobacterium lindanitolerans]RLJ34851.1 DNA invertase Pin-like site-specific DNA recombinase [Flavobacterium lindanitolerans]